MTLVNYVKY